MGCSSGDQESLTGSLLNTVSPWKLGSVAALNPGVLIVRQLASLVVVTTIVCPS